MTRRDEERIQDIAEACGRLAYFVADHDILWDTITRDVPALAAKIAAIRGSAGQ